MSIQDDIKDILAKLSCLEDRINTLSSVVKTRRTEVKYLREDVDKNKKALYALLNNNIFAFVSKAINEENTIEDYFTQELVTKGKFYIH